MIRTYFFIAYHHNITRSDGKETLCKHSGEWMDAPTQLRVSAA